MIMQNLPAAAQGRAEQGGGLSLRPSGCASRGSVPVHRPAPVII